MSTLFIGAHPDDIILGCGGTVCRFTAEKKDVFCYYTTNGVYTDIHGNLIRDFDEISETVYKCLGLFGVKQENILFNENTEATRLQVNKENISKLQAFIIENDIKIIFTHSDPDTYHQDHRATHNITMASARRYVNNIFLYEIIFNYAAGIMIPNYYIDITKHIEKKNEALRLHRTEYDKYNGEEWIDSVDSLAKFRGRQCGKSYAEAFYVMKYLLE